MLIGPNLPHVWRNTGPIPGDPDYTRVQFVQSSMDFLGETFFEIPEMRPIYDMIIRAQRGLAFEGETRTRAADAMGQLAELSGLT